MTNRAGGSAVAGIFLVPALALVLFSGCSTAPGSHEATDKITDKTEITGSSVDVAVVEKELRHEENPKTDLDSADDTAIPKEVNDLVLKWVDYFTTKGRSHMVRYLGRESRYAPAMKEVFKKQGLPEDLVYLALIESGFAGNVKSHANAVGYWQFMRATGKTYGLKISNLVDERRDFVKSTEAAAAYLKGLYNLFGSWYLAIASYNVGENRIKHVVMQEQTRDFWKLARSSRLPAETKDYVPKFIAARMIAKHPEKFGITDLELQKPLEFENVAIENPISLRLLAQKLDVDYGDLQELNPAYRTEYVPLNTAGATELRVPLNTGDDAKDLVAECQVRESKHFIASVDAEEGYQKHRVRSGETLGVIARRYGVSLSALRDANELSRRGMIHVGQVLNVPAKRRSRRVASSDRGSLSRARSKLRSRSTSVSIAGRVARVKPRQKPPRPKRYVVRRGDTLEEIARRHNISVHVLARKNKIASRDEIMAGTRLNIPTSL